MSCLAYTKDDADKEKQRQLIKFLMDKTFPQLVTAEDLNDTIFSLLKKQKYELAAFLLPYAGYDMTSEFALAVTKAHNGNGNDDDEVKVQRQLETYEKLIFKEQPPTTVMNITRYGTPEQLQVLLRSRNKVRIHADQLWAALILACKRGLVEKAKILLDHYAYDDDYDTDERRICPVEHVSRLPKDLANRIMDRILVHVEPSDSSLERGMFWAIRLGNRKLACEFYTRLERYVRLGTQRIPHLRDGYNNTLMGNACFYGVKKSICFLLGVGVKPTSDDLQRLINIDNAELFDMVLQQVFK